MVQLSTFGRDLKAMKEGEWIVPAIEFPEVRIRTKAMGSEYADNQAARMKRAARNYGGEAKIGQAERNLINIEALIETCLLDVEGFTNDDGTATTFGQFCDAIRKEENNQLAVMCFESAQQVGQRRAELAENAKGN